MRISRFSQLTGISLRRRSTGGKTPEPSLTCAFLQVAGSFSVHPQLTVEILLPELREPNVPPVVGQRAAPEVPIERCGGGTKKSDHTWDVHAAGAAPRGRSNDPIVWATGAVSVHLSRCQGNGLCAAPACPPPPVALRLPGRDGLGLLRSSTGCGCQLASRSPR